MTGVMDLRIALDRVEFARSCGLEPDPWQRQLLTSENPRVMLNVSRQGGKSSLSALLALHRALYYPESLILLLAPALRQSQELYGKVRHFYGEISTAPETVQETALTMRLSNGSRIISLPGNEKSIRGYSGAALLIVDEAARVEDALYYSIRPMLAVSGGRLVLLSTPYGKRGAFYDEWTGEESWERYEINAHQVPRISEEFLEEERRSLGDWWWNQEYMCNPPEAPVWMGDLSFQPLGDVRAGDTVIGWERPATSKKRHLTRATVLAVGRREADIVEVRMESGNVIYCTPNHKWLTMSAGHGQDWFQPALVGKRLVRVIQPSPALPESLRWDAAWLGGIYDGEGSADHIAQSRAHNPAIHARIKGVVEALGLRAADHSEGFYIQSRNGGRARKQALVDFLNWTQPTKRDKYMDRHILGAHFRHPDTVVDVRPAGRSDVISLQTTTGNYVVWGYASKNCEFGDTLFQIFSTETIEQLFSHDAGEDDVPLIL